MKQKMGLKKGANKQEGMRAKFNQNKIQEWLSNTYLSFTLKNKKSAL